MPGRDQTGPLGAGPATGRGAGGCSGTGAPAGARSFAAWGAGRGGRSSRGGWRHRFLQTGLFRWQRSPASQTEAELDGLKQEAGWLQSQLTAIQQRITELEKK
jgi:hypothetical protein